MRVLYGLAAIAFCLAADDAPRGLPARPTAADYAARAQWQHTTFAASLVPGKQVQHLFAFDISKAFLVFEVACYSDNGPALSLSREAFVIRVDASGDAIHHAEPDTVAAAVQRQNLPPTPSSHETTISTGAVIGYEHGTDPYTGRPVNGVYTAGSVGVEQGGSAPPPQYPKPGGTYEDRRLLEAQLRARSLPEGPVEHSVAGYLFFRKADLKTQPDNTYSLEFLSSNTGAVTIAVPKKH